MAFRRDDRGTPRRGMTLVEVAGAVLLLAVALSATVRLVGFVAAERRTAARRQCAAREAANLMEDLAARPFDRLVPGPVADVALSADARRVLPGAELIARVAEDEEEPLRRVRVEVRWRDASGRPGAPVRLTAWVARHREVGR